MGVHSGKFGIVDGIEGVRNWSINETAAVQSYVASNTQGGTDRKDGVTDWTGSFNAYGGRPSVLPGDVFTFQGYTAPDDDELGSDGEIYSGSAIVDSVAITWAWDSGQIISYTVNFSSNGELTVSSGLLEDISIPDFKSSLEGAKIVIAGIGSGSGTGELCHILNATLNLLSANTSYANSCTDGQTERKPGIKDWNLSVTLQDNTRAGLAVNDDVELEIYIDDTLFWHLQWGKVLDFSGLTVDRETGAIISQTINIAMKGFLDGEVGVVEIDDTQWWPEAA